MNDCVDPKLLVPENRTDILLARPLPDEPLFSYVTRLTRLSPMIEMRTLIEYLFGGRYVELERPLGSGFNVLAERLQWVDGRSSKELLIGHSLLPLFQTFADQARFERACNRALSSRGSGIHLSLGWRDGIVRKSPAICLDCVDADIRKHHFSYYRRAHLVTALTHCPTHGTQLLTQCTACGNNFPHWKLPTKDCPHCGEPLASDVDHSIEPKQHAARIRLSRLLASMLSGVLSPVGTTLHLSVLRQRISEVVPTRHGALGSNLAGYLNNTFGSGLLQQLGLATASAPTLGWPALLINGRVLINDPIANALLVTALFESANEYERSLNKALVANDYQSIRPRSLVGARNLTLSMLKDALRGIPVESIAKAHKMNTSQLFTWLSAYPDASRRRAKNVKPKKSPRKALSLFDQLSTRPEQQNEFDDVDPAARDAGPIAIGLDETLSRDLRQHVRKLAKCSGRPLRLDKVRLTKIAGLDQFSPEKQQQFACTLATIEELSEEEEDYSRRCLKWAATDLAGNNGRCDHLAELFVHAVVPVQFVRRLELYARSLLDPCAT